MSDPIADLAEIMKDSGLKIRFGLEQQGHMPTIRRMLDAGSAWGEIGAAIGWDPKTAMLWFQRATMRDLAAGLRDMIATGRLTEADIPDDFEWLCRALEGAGFGATVPEEGVG